MRFRKWLAATSAPLLLATISLGGCARPSGGGPNLVIITFDTLRRDHLEIYGYERDTAPRLRGLAREGATFADAITPIPKTAPALASMFTGRYPTGHGLRHNMSHTLSEDVPTLAEILQERGYRTAAFVANQVLVRSIQIPSGLDRGFDVYDDRLTRPERNRPQIHERPAEPLTDAALEWMRSDLEEPFFLWVHYIDPHGPYVPPEPHRSRFKSPNPSYIRPFEPGMQASFPFFFIAQWNLLDDLPVESDRHDLNFHVDRYDGEIRYADEQVGRLLEALDDEGLAERSLVVFTSDHGESFGEHGIYFEHGFDLYDENVRIPLLMRFPSRIRPGTVMEERVQLCDVLPTCLGFLDVPLPPGLDGRTLRLALEEGQPLEPVPILLETNEATSVTHRWPRALLDGDWKCIIGFGHDEAQGGFVPQFEELYDRATDPREQSNLVASEPERHARMHARIVEAVAGTIVDPAAARAEAIGYFGINEPVDPVRVYERWKANDGADGIAPLVGLGKNAIPTLAEAMATDDEPLLSLEGQVIQKIDWLPSVLYLRRALVDAAEAGRPANVERIRATLLTFPTDAVVLELEKALKRGKSAHARRVAAETLAYERFQRAAPSLVRALADENRSVRLAAAGALQALPADSPSEEDALAMLERLRIENLAEPRDREMIALLCEILFERCGKDRALFGGAAPAGSGSHAAPDRAAIEAAIPRVRTALGSRSRRAGG
jgi:arylsulfatase A-like enzyme